MLKHCGFQKVLYIKKEELQQNYCNLSGSVARMDTSTAAVMPSCLMLLEIDGHVQEVQH